jgi:hypothetical protein
MVGDAEAARERLRKQPIREPRVARQQRPVQIGADGAADAAALEPARAIVAEAGDDAAERLRAGIEVGATGVVLEAGERPPHVRLDLALDQDVSDHAGLTGDGLERKQADARQVGAVEVAVRTAHQLVAAADGEQRRSGRNRLAHAVRLGDEVLRDERLLAVLSAADVEQVVLARTHLLADRHGPQLELVAAPRRAPREDCDVAAVGVDVQVVGIEMSDHDLHAARSQ